MDVVAAHRARLDETRLYFDQLRRTYAEISDAKYEAVFRKHFIWGRGAIEQGLRETFGDRPLAAQRRIAEVRKTIKPLRIIGGKAPRKRA